MVTKRERSAVQVRLHDEEWTVQVFGELDRGCASELAAAVTEHLSVEARDVVLDLSTTTFLDGGGLAAIEDSKRRCEEGGRSLRIDARMDAGVERVLAIVGLVELVRDRTA